MAMGDVYTALQTGIIDGTENNETALTTGMHGEICKFYSVDQHTMIPDVLVIATDTWEKLSEEDRQLLIDTAKESTEKSYRKMGAGCGGGCETATNDMGVTSSKMWTSRRSAQPQQI